jgi:hypothetical protein
LAVFFAGALTATGFAAAVFALAPLAGALFAAGLLVATLLVATQSPSCNGFTTVHSCKVVFMQAFAPLLPILALAPHPISHFAVPWTGSFRS